MKQLALVLPMATAWAITQWEKEIDLKMRSQSEAPEDPEGIQGKEDIRKLCRQNF